MKNNIQSICNQCAISSNFAKLRKRITRPIELNMNQSLTNDLLKFDE